jgi:hypothetical protein
MKEYNIWKVDRFLSSGEGAETPALLGHEKEITSITGPVIEASSFISVIHHRQNPLEPTNKEWLRRKAEFKEGREKMTSEREGCEGGKGN